MIGYGSDKNVYSVEHQELFKQFSFFYTTLTRSLYWDGSYFVFISTANG